MASSNIKLFDENKGNMISDSEFSVSNQRLNGLQTGVASSQLQNKAMYQASLVAYAIAQVMMQNGKNANDTDAVSAFVANLSGTMLQKVYDLATTEEAQAGVATGKWMSPALTKAFYDYMKANSAEALEGTNYEKWMSPALVKLAIDTLAAKASNILSDETKALYKLKSTATPNDVFAKLAMPYGYYGFNITTVFSDGTPVPYVILNGLQDFSGNTVMTDENGKYVAAVSESKTATVKISDYIGVTDAQVTISAEDGIVYTPVTITLERDISMHLIQKSKSIRVLTGVPVDMCIVGGGAGGNPTSPIDGAGAGGGGGYVKNIMGVVLSNLDVSVAIGSGGAANSAGGSTSVTYNGITETVDGAPGQFGNGNGGNGYEHGTDGTVRVFNDPSLPLPGGGGAGGVRYGVDPYNGGADFGGRGVGGKYPPGPFSGTGPGGGGGGGGYNSTLGAPGAAGGLYIRVNAPEVNA